MYNILKKCAYYWRSIGIQLEFGRAVLDEIQRNRRDDRECLSVLLDKWLNRKNASWKVLVSALEEFDEDDDFDKSIVDKIKQKYDC